LTDTLGSILELHVHAANRQDPAGAKDFLLRLQTKHWRLKKIWADARYRALIDWVHELRHGRGRRRLELEIVAKTAAGKFVVLPKRWIVERTFAWFGQSRRLSKDYDPLCETTETWILITMIYLMTKRLALRH
jgi:putative transposase